MSKLLTAAGTAVKGFTVADWSDLVSWTHSWDAIDASTYVPSGAEQAAFSVDASPRISSVLDRSGSRPLLKDNGYYGGNFSVLPLPGHKYLASSPRFKGRPAGRAALMVDHGGSFDLFAMLTPNASANTADWFNTPTGYAAPYWIAALCRMPVVTGKLSAAFDASRGDLGTTPTVAGTGSVNWSGQMWISNAPHTTLTTSHVMSKDETVLAICYISAAGTGSFIEVNWRDSAGLYQTQRQTGTLDTYTAKEMFHGYVEATYWSASGLKQGVPTTTELNKIREWACGYMPAAASLADE